MSTVGAGKLNQLFRIHKRQRYILPLVFLCSACSSTTPNLWQGGDVVIDAKQEVLEREVDTVSEQHEELVEKFVELERLYISLAARVEAQERNFKQAEANGVVSSADLQALQNIVNRSQSEISELTSTVSGLENRVYTVEIASAVAVGPITTAPVTEASTEEVSEELSEAETTDTVSSSSAETAEPSADIVDSFGIHLASYRSQDQVAGGWASILTTYSELEGTTPLIFTQSQEGIGDFLRLITGPYSSEVLASEACDRIKQVSAEQYCKVSPYEGNPFTG